MVKFQSSLNESDSKNGVIISVMIWITKPLFQSSLNESNSKNNSVFAGILRKALYGFNPL